jgi:hypothetical protein
MWKVEGEDDINFEFLFFAKHSKYQKNHNESLEHKRTLVVELLGITSLSIKLREE